MQDNDNTQAVPSPEPESKAQKFARDFWNQYEPIVERARQAEATTKTDGWAQQYAHTQKESRKKIVGCCKAIENAVKIIAAEDTSEGLEKAIKDTVKELSEEREGRDAWRARAVRPFSRLAEDAQRIIDELKRKARDVETANPLVWGGLAFEVDQHIHSTWPSVEWDAETGTVTVVEV